METIITTAMNAGMTREQAVDYANTMVALVEAQQRADAVAAQVEAGAMTTRAVGTVLSATKDATKTVGTVATNFLSGLFAAM